MRGWGWDAFYMSYILFNRVCECARTNTNNALSRRPRGAAHSCSERTRPEARFCRQWPLAKPLFSALMMCSSEWWERWTLSGGAALLMTGDGGAEKEGGKRESKLPGAARHQAVGREWSGPGHMDQITQKINWISSSPGTHTGAEAVWPLPGAAHMMHVKW